MQLGKPVYNLEKFIKIESEDELFLFTLDTFRFFKENVKIPEQKGSILIGIDKILYVYYNIIELGYKTFSPEATIKLLYTHEQKYHVLGKIMKFLKDSYPSFN